MCGFINSFSTNMVLGTIGRPSPKQEYNVTKSTFKKVLWQKRCTQLDAASMRRWLYGGTDAY